jgi:hypothetical protein
LGVALGVLLVDRHYHRQAEMPFSHFRLCLGICRYSAEAQSLCSSCWRELRWGFRVRRCAN